MYRINRQQNDIVQLEEKSFHELQFKEREHLQEWIAKNPQVLGGGDDLLIIQKEFAGFNDTNERLDLLALDKDGRLVIIENKLDDSGKDVVWQALKYTSYCSTLSTSQILKIYQDYLDRYANGEDAKTNVLDFLSLEEDSELLLNRQDQRMIFVANNFRKEVTSTVLWLLNHDIQIQCFKAKPYVLDNEVLLQIEQIIPLPETQEFMIDAKQKQREETGKSQTVADSEAYLMEFWRDLKTEMQHRGFQYFDNVSAKPSYNIGLWKWEGRFGMAVGTHAVRVELYFSSDANKTLFDAMFERKAEIESLYGKEITWERLDNKKATRIRHDLSKEAYLEMPAWKGDESGKQQRIDWLINEFDQFYKAVYPVWEKVRLELKA
ncbi:MAG: DUF4268 domain-containing protein [Pseudomonadota bacterium]|nr:DUF4268 domain-containing protein [Pseudomonadota bacterium]